MRTCNCRCWGVMAAVPAGFHVGQLGDSAPCGRKTAEKRPKGPEAPQGHFGATWFMILPSTARGAAPQSAPPGPLAKARGRWSPARAMVPPFRSRFARGGWSTEKIEIAKRQTLWRACGRVERRSDGAAARSTCCRWRSMPSLPSADAEKVFNIELHHSIDFSENAAPLL